MFYVWRNIILIDWHHEDLMTLEMEVSLGLHPWEPSALGSVDLHDALSTNQYV